LDSETLAKKYPLIAIATALLLLGSVAAFNAVIDPYGMYRLLEIRGFNLHKPAIYHRVRLFKAYDIRRIKPSAIVLGTSRSHVGIRMSYEGWDATAAPRYNLAFDGATTKEMYFYLKHTYAIHPLKQVVLGLDTYHPTGAPSGSRPDFDPKLLCETRSLTSLLTMRLEDLKLLISIDTLRASITTLKSQDGGQPEWFAADGQRLGEIFFRQTEEKFQKCPRTYFEEIDKLEVGFKLEGRYPATKKSVHQALTPPQETKDETSLGYIRRIIEFCRAKHIDLRIFITPEHAHQMEISAVLGEWPSIEKAKRNLVDLLSDDAAKHPGEPQIPLYDFSGYNSVTTEELPKPGSRTEMKYYWDSSHFKEIVGDFVLSRLFGVSSLKHSVPADFGIQLTADTVDSALARIRSEQITYRKHHPQDVVAICLLVNSVLRRNTDNLSASGMRSITQPVHRN
jgi:hypothetical protein